MGYTLRPRRIKVKDDDGAYHDITAIGLDSTEELIEQIETKGAQINQSIETKGATTISSIPDDYTELSDEVTSLKEDLVNQRNDISTLQTGFDFDTGDNVFNSNDTSAVLRGKNIDSDGNIIDGLYNVVFVPVYDTDALYTMMYKNTAGTLWINQTAPPTGCYDVNKRTLGVATPTANGVTIPFADTRYIGMKISDAGLELMPMIIKDWDGVNKTTFVAYRSPVATPKGITILQAQADDTRDNQKIDREALDFNGEFFFKSAGYNLMNDNAAGAGAGTIRPENGNVNENTLTTHYHSDYIPVQGLDYISAFAFQPNSQGVLNLEKPMLSYQRLAFYKEDYSYDSGIDNNATRADLTTASVPVPPNAHYVRIGFNGTKNDTYRMVVAGRWTGAYVPYAETRRNIMQTISQWKGKTWSAYGDSITAITNSNGLTTGWAKYINEHFDTAMFYGRGIGSQKFNYNEHGGSVAFVDSTGMLNSRSDSYNKDNYTGTVPAGCTAIRGAFCSWDRITHMYPADIKDTIDMVFVMGSTNDNDDSAELTWVANSTVDAEWAASSYYATYGGDYNINTLRGGVASTIMKMQAWMPNAVIVLATPLNGQTNQSGQIRPNYIPDEYEKGIKVMEIARKFGTPCVDVFGTCGINTLNSPTYITDGTHPYNTEGHKALARAIIGGLKSIMPKL